MFRRALPVVALAVVLGGFAGYRWAPWRESPRGVVNGVGTRRKR